MRIFNVGIREVLLLLVIMLILFGPNQMRENARKAAQAIRRFVRSDTWRSFLGIYDDVNTIKNEMIRESGIQEVRDSLRGVDRQLNEIDSEMRRNEMPGEMPRPVIPHPDPESLSESDNSHESESDPS